MKILFFGDVVGRPGRQALAKIFAIWHKTYAPDFIIANGENLAHGDGVTAETLAEVLSLGVDAVTSGNHIFHHREAAALLDDPSKKLIRPANLGTHDPGRGWMTVEKNGARICVVNLIGITQFRPHVYANPFYAASDIIGELAKQYSDAPIVVDFHAEATSEKKAMGWFLDGTVAALIGTHTHVPTRDERVLPKGTAYITDVGMVGVRDSVLGVESDAVVHNFMHEQKMPIEIAEGPVEINAVLIDVTEGGMYADSIIHLRELV